MAYMRTFWIFRKVLLPVSRTLGVSRNNSFKSNVSNLKFYKLILPFSVSNVLFAFGNVQKKTSDNNPSPAICHH